MTGPAARYSKPVGDIAPETARIVREDAAMLAHQREHTAVLAAQPARAACVLCGGPAAGERFRHRGLDCFECAVCGQVQTVAQPPEGYPASTGATFDWVYPDLDPVAYAARRDRVYAPKLDWALEAMAENGIGRAEALRRRWLDLGAGAGYFLDALREAGCADYTGVEANRALAEAACRRLGEDRVRIEAGSLAEAIRRHGADVVSAWFVFEHVEGGHAVWEAFADMPKGTLVLFAVPVFGLSSAFESAFGDHWARGLDGVVHTQLYTDRSIDWALRRGGLKPLAEWVFGQDMVDIARLLAVRLGKAWPQSRIDALMGRLHAALDPLQGAVDRALLADARHILAIRD
ncbi:MAG: class I SAM-dependent methyltransferase [Actinomycetota bacterium]